MRIKLVDENAETFDYDPFFNRDTIMGWAIINGIKFTTNDIFDIHNRVQAFRGVVRLMTRKMLLDVLVEDIVTEIDITMGREKPMPPNMLRTALGKAYDAAREIKKTGYRNPKYDFDFSLSIMPFEGAFYGIIHCEHDAWRRKFIATKLAKPFGWHDNERPSHIPAKEWNERGRIWKTIFDHDSRPSANGFSYELTIPEYQIGRITAAEVSRAIARKNPFEKRVRRIAKDHIIHERMEADPKLDRSEGGHISWMGCYRRAVDFIKTDEGQAVVDAECLVVEKLLLPKIEASML
jgi:hypothetical protein